MKYLSVAQTYWRRCEATNVEYTHGFWLRPEIVHMVIIKILGYLICRLYVILYFGNITGDTVFRQDRYLLKIL